MDSLFIDELIRVKADSAVIMRSLAKRGTTLNKFADVADELKLSEVIEISADSARIMKSLVARDCLIKDLDKIANDLTLSETVDVKFDEFTPDASGKYVKVVGDGYVFYDENNTLMRGMQRFKKDSSSSPATYVADDNGSFVHDFYFTLYNIATHSDSTLYTRYDRTAVGDASSKVLQRLAFSNIGDFSTAFDVLTLGDVIDIDPDVLEVADAAYKLANPTVTYYAYDETNHVFKRDETGVYYVSRAGKSSAVLKRLAFVPVNSLSTALDTIIKDMLLSELIDVYEQYAVSVDTTIILHPRLLRPFKKRIDLSSTRSATTKAAKHTRLCTTNSANTSQEITLSSPPRLKISPKTERCALPTKSSTPLPKSHLRQQTAACTTSTAKNTWTTPPFAYILRQLANLTICTPERA